MAPQKRSQRGGGGSIGAAAAAAASSQAAGDSGDAVMARWLQSAGLQHLAASSAAAGVGTGDLRSVGGGGVLPNLLMQVRLSSDSVSCLLRLGLVVSLALWPQKACCRTRVVPCRDDQLLRRRGSFAFASIGICRVFLQRYILCYYFIWIALGMIGNLVTLFYCFIWILNNF